MIGEEEKCLNCLHYKELILWDSKLGVAPYYEKVSHCCTVYISSGTVYQLQEKDADGLCELYTPKANTTNNNDD